MGSDELSLRNRQTVLDFYAAGVRGDLDAFVSFMSEDFVLHEPPFLPYGGAYRTKQGMLEGFAKICEYLDVSGLEIDHMVADGEHVIGILRAPDRATGELVLIAEESTLRDGKIVEMRVFFHEGRSLIKR
jgi:hypothetical protein